MKDSINRAIELIFNHHFKKIVFLDIVGKRQILQILPLLVRRKLVNDKYVANLSPV